MGEKWRHFRSTQTGVGTYADVEDLLQTEADSFFKFRITDWKSHDRSP
jgi:hypothetical protein